MEMKLLNITPNMATILLEKNCANRPISKRTVEAYARDMLNGHWKEGTGAAISVSTDGELLDGQHRLNAIIQSKLTVKMWVCLGCDKGGVYDNNRRRTVRDQLNISRSDLPLVMRSNSFLGVIHFTLAGTHKASVGDIEDYIDAHREELEGFISLGVLTAAKRPKISICAVYTALYWAYINGVPGKTIADFYEVLRSGMASDPKEYPIIAFRNYLLEAISTKSTTEESIKLCQGALKKYMTGSCSKRICQPKELLWSTKEARVG